LRYGTKGKDFQNNWEMMIRRHVDLELSVASELSKVTNGAGGLVLGWVWSVCFGEVCWVDFHLNQSVFWDFGHLETKIFSKL
jgi:hypothetical protein